MPTMQTIDTTEGDTAELCIERLTSKLSEVEIVMATNEGKVNQMRKERDAERAANERLQKEITKLNTERLRERMNFARRESEILQEEDETEGTNGAAKPDNINCDHLMTSQRRRGSLPVTSLWGQSGRRGSQLDNCRDLRKLLDKRSNEVLQQRQQYRIFENRFQHETEKCSKLEQDTERLKQLLVDLLGIHSRHHRSYVFPCNNFTAATFIVLIALTIIAVFVFVMKEHQF